MKSYYNPNYGRFQVKGPRKKVNVEQFFVYELCKILRQFDDFGGLLDTFLNFWGGFSQKCKIN